MSKTLRKLLIAPVLLASTLAFASDGYVIGPPGAYTVQTPGTTKVERGDGWIKITWSNDPAPNPGPTPGPTPEPPPNPTPPPAPVATGKLYVSLVYDYKAETQDQAAARADMATSDAWGPLGATFRAYSIQQDELDKLNLRSSLAELPCLVIQELKPDGKTAPVVKVIPAADAKAAIEAVKALRGTK